jgi:hypothetical protein
MKKLIMFLMFCCSSAVFAVSVQMPSAEIIKDRLKAIGLSDFAEKTTIIELAGQIMELQFVNQQVEEKLKDYIGHVHENSFADALAIALAILKHRPMVLKELVKDSPVALMVLTKQKLL